VSFTIIEKEEFNSKTILISLMMSFQLFVLNSKRLTRVSHLFTKQVFKISTIVSDADASNTTHFKNPGLCKNYNLPA